MSSKNSELENIKDNIWKTRKARINTAERLKSLSVFIKFLNMYYSCWIMVINLIDISSEKYDFAIISLAMSIVLTISIFFLDSQQYLERSEKIKDCYIDLQKLYHDISEENIVEKRKEYYEILRKNENHSEYDYYKVSIDNNQATIINIIKYYTHWLLVNITKAFFILLPLLFILYTKVK